MIEAFEDGETRLPPSGILYKVASQRILDEHAKWIAAGLTTEGWNLEPDFVLEPGNCGEVFFEGRYERESAVELSLPSLPLANPKLVTLDSIRFYRDDNKYEAVRKEAVFTDIAVTVFNDYEDSLGYDRDWFDILLSSESPPTIRHNGDNGPIFEYMNEGQREFHAHIESTVQDPTDRLIRHIMDSPELKWPGQAKLSEEECAQLVGLIKNDVRETTPNGP